MCKIFTIALIAFVLGLILSSTWKDEKPYVVIKHNNHSEYHVIDI
jgi:hypothetical protein